MSWARTGNCASSAGTTGLPGTPAPATPLVPICPKLVSAVRMRYISASLGSREPRPGPGPAPGPKSPGEFVWEERLEALAAAPFSADALLISPLLGAPPSAGPPAEPTAEPGAAAP